MQLLKQKLQPCLRADKLQREISQLVEKTDPAMQEFVTRWSSIQTGQKPIQSIEPAAARLRRLISDLDAKMRELADSDLPDPAILVEDDTEAIRSNRQNFSRWTKSLALQAAQLPWGLYSAGDEAISIVPALEATALEADRYRSEIHPWISLHALLRGSPGLLHGYPSEDVQEDPCRLARRANRLFQPRRRRRREPICRGDAAVYIRRTRAGRGDRTRSTAASHRGTRPRAAGQDGLSARLSPPMPKCFTIGSIRSSGRACASLAAVCILGLSFIALRKPLFWTGIAMMVVGVGLVVGGFVVRMYITHWAPVTSMFETIVWVAMCMSLLTLWVTFLPLLGPTSKSGLAFDGHSRQLGSRQSGSTDRRDCDRIAGPPESSQAGIRAVALAMRLVLFVAGLFVGLYYMGVLQPGSGGSGY